MNYKALLKKLEKGLRFLAGLALSLLAFQTLGVLMYVITVWPHMDKTPPVGLTAIATVALAAGLARSSLWVSIYWNGATILNTLQDNGESTALPGKLAPKLKKMTRLLLISCVLDVLLLPAIFMMDSFFPFTLSSWQLGLVQLAILLMPQAFGVAALILAYITYQFGRLMQEHYRMKQDLELTI